MRRPTNVWGANGLIGRQSGAASAITPYLWDDRGNVAHILNANGSVATNFNATSWGDVVRNQSSYEPYGALGGQFGNYFDIETGLVLCGQRYYDSSNGRWINRDPIGTAGGLNVYGYCGNNPVSRVDPKGLDYYIITWGGGNGFGSHAAIGVDLHGKGNNGRIAAFDNGPATHDDDSRYLMFHFVPGEVLPIYNFNRLCCMNRY